jgi:hypothetical protein
MADEYAVAVKGELTADQVEMLRSAGIRLDDKIGPTTYAGFNELGPVATYVVLDAQDEGDARRKVADPLGVGVDPRELVSARPRSI